MAKKNTTQLVLGKLGKRGKTTVQIADSLKANPTTVGTILSSLVREGTVQIVGKSQAAGAGRPANLYALSA